MSFSSDLSNFSQKTLDTFSKVKRASSLELFTAIIIGTPVDKGVLRNNWFANIGSGSTRSTGHADPSGSVSISRIKNVIAKGGIGEDIYFTNNSAYAVPIEFDGHSGKAPDGMVRVNVLKWSSIVDSNTRKFSRGI